MEIESSHYFSNEDTHMLIHTGNVCFVYFFFSTLLVFGVKGGGEESVLHCFLVYILPRKKAT